MADIKINLKMKKEIQDMVERLDKIEDEVSRKVVYNLINEVTDKLHAESVRRSPVDEGLLEKSHEKEVNQSASAIETEGVVFISTNAPAAEYAMYMHELEYRLGPASMRKQVADSGVTVGRKYLERALSENIKKFQRYMAGTLREYFGD